MIEKLKKDIEELESSKPYYEHLEFFNRLFIKEINRLKLILNELNYKNNI
jgi:hypothetical protein